MAHAMYTRLLSRTARKENQMYHSQSHYLEVALLFSHLLSVDAKIFKKSFDIIFCHENFKKLPLKVAYFTAQIEIFATANCPETSPLPGTYLYIAICILIYISGDASIE